MRRVSVWLWRREPWTKFVVYPLIGPQTLYTPNLNLVRSSHRFGVRKGWGVGQFGTWFGLRAWGLGPWELHLFRVWGLGFGVWGLGV